MALNTTLLFALYYPPDLISAESICGTDLNTRGIFTLNANPGITACILLILFHPYPGHGEAEIAFMDKGTGENTTVAAGAPLLFYD
jgi:hypothetical protein